MVLQLSGQTPFAELNEIITTMADEEREHECVKGHILASLTVKNHQNQSNSGDYLERNIVADDSSVAP